MLPDSSRYRHQSPITNDPSATWTHSPHFLHQSTQQPRLITNFQSQSSAKKQAFSPNELNARFEKSREQMAKSFSQKDSLILPKVRADMIELENKSLLFEQSIKKALIENQENNSRPATPLLNWKELSQVSLKDKYMNRNVSPSRMFSHTPRSTSNHSSPLKRRDSSMVRPSRKKSGPVHILSDKFRCLFPLQRRIELLQKLKQTLVKTASTKKNLKDVSNREIFPRLKFELPNSKKFFLAVKAGDLETTKTILRTNPNHIFQFDDVS
jgi:hypothetical protein